MKFDRVEISNYLKEETRKHYKEALEVLEHYSFRKGSIGAYNVTLLLLSIVFLILIFIVENKMLMFGLFIISWILMIFNGQMYAKNDIKVKIVKECISSLIEENESKENE